MYVYYYLRPNTLRRRTSVVEKPPSPSSCNWCCFFATTYLLKLK